MKYLSICSGIEAATVAWHSLGWEPVGFSEIEAFPSAVLAHRFPDVPNFGDMTKFKNWTINESDVDILVGGTPCQSFSVAGLRKGLSDDRGNLALTFCEMADHFDPEYVLWENVPGVLSTKDNAFGCFLAGLAGEDEPLVPPGGKWTNAGYVLGPKRAIAWRVLDAQYFGVAQRRRRVFVVGCPRNGADPRTILFESEGVRRDTPPSRKKREGTASASGRGVASSSWPAEVSSTLDTTFGTKQGLEDQHVNAGCPLFVPAMTVQTQGHEPAVTARMTAFGEYVDDGTASTLKQRDSKDATDLVAQPVAFGGDIARTLQARHDSSPCADRGMDVVATAMQVRRLTPTECERLQGFPDGWTAIPWRGKPAEDCPDGPRYKALGNSMAVPVMRWIGNRIKSIETI